MLIGRRRMKRSTNWEATDLQTVHSTIESNRLLGICVRATIRGPIPGLEAQLHRSRKIVYLQ